METWVDTFWVDVRVGCALYFLCLGPWALLTVGIHELHPIKGIVGVYMLTHFGCVWLFATPRTATRWAPLSVGFSSQEYWSGLPCPPQGKVPEPGIKPRSHAVPELQTDSLLLGHQGSPELIVCVFSSLLYCDQFENNDHIWLTLFSLQFPRQHAVISLNEWMNISGFS